jgi:hypothetical protein
VAKIQVRCVGCGAVRDVGEDESRAISAADSVPFCKKCGSPMVAIKIEAKDEHG